MYNDKYKELVHTILTKGQWQEARNGQCLIIPHYSFTINAKDWRLNLRKMWYSGVRAEWDTLMDTENPLTNVKQFKDRGCNYWDNFAAEDGSIRLDYYDMLHSQLEDVIKNIKRNPHDRGHVVELWNHNNVKSGVLSLRCCWHGFTISVIGSTAHLNWVQRSVDTMLGLPADVYLAYLFLNHICDEVGLNMGTMSFDLSNAHIYQQHIDGAKEIMNRTEADYNKPLKFELIP